MLCLSSRWLPVVFFLETLFTKRVSNFPKTFIVVPNRFRTVCLCQSFVVLCFRVRNLFVIPITFDLPYFAIVIPNNFPMKKKLIIICNQYIAN